MRDALPFGLKTMEALLADDPGNRELALATCRGFAQYAHAFVQADAEEVELDDWEEAERLRQRALRMYLRALGYGLQALETRAPGIGAELSTRPAEAVLRLDDADVEGAYWTGVAWGSAIAIGMDRPELVADVDAARSLLGRVLELDETYGEGAIHLALIPIEALPEAMGGSLERARSHFERGVELTHGESAGPYVAYATAVSIGEQDRAEFERLLELALAIDPDAVPSKRLANLIDQRRARHLLGAADDLFLDPLE